jgi:hypothetical protein
MCGKKKDHWNASGGVLGTSATHRPLGHYFQHKLAENSTKTFLLLNTFKTLNQNSLKFDYGTHY